MNKVWDGGSRNTKGSVYRVEIFRLYRGTRRQNM